MLRLKVDIRCRSALWVFAAALVLWETAARFGLIDTFLFPQPSKVLMTACAMFSSGELARHFLLTFNRFFWGFSCGCLAGVLLGFFYGLSKRVQFFIDPALYLFHPVPKFALLPFLILFFGTGMASKVAFIALSTFFPIAFSTIDGLRQTNKDYLEVARHYGAEGVGLYRRVIWPGVLPWLFSGLRISCGITLTYTIIVEFLTTTNGVGAMMWLSLQTLQIDKLFLGVAVISIWNFIMIGLINRLERMLVPWKPAAHFLDEI